MQAKMASMSDSSTADISKTFSFPNPLRYSTSLVSILFLIKMHDPPDAL
jgi:hypothetical protein